MLSHILGLLDCTPELLDELNILDSDLAIFQRLEKGGYYAKAIKFLAYGLPKREAIWWAYLASEALEKDNDDPIAQETLTLIETWVREPQEAKRRHAGKLAQALEYYTPSSWTAMAIFWSGGSITPENRPTVEASDEMCAEAVSNAIVISGQKLSTHHAENYSRFLRQGLHIAMGGNGRISQEPA